MNTLPSPRNDLVTTFLRSGVMVFQCETPVPAKRIPTHSLQNNAHSLLKKHQYFESDQNV